MDGGLTEFLRAAITAGATFPLLETLDLGENRLGDEAVRLLADALKPTYSYMQGHSRNGDLLFGGLAPALRELSLDANRLALDALGVLLAAFEADMQFLKLLRKLNLEKNPSVPTKAAAARAEEGRALTVLL